MHTSIPTYTCIHRILLNKSSFSLSIFHIRVLFPTQNGPNQKPLINKKSTNQPVELFFVLCLTSRYVLVGHSERRSLYGETDEDCAAKTKVGGVVCRERGRKKKWLVLSGCKLTWPMAKL